LAANRNTRINRLFDEFATTVRFSTTCASNFELLHPPEIRHVAWPCSLYWTRTLPVDGALPDLFRYYFCSCLPTFYFGWRLI
jgi:hypothetical protein